MIFTQSAWPSKPFGDYEVKWTDYEPPMQRVWIDASMFHSKDVGFIKDLLLKQPPEFRAFVLESARLICEAGEGLGE